MSRIQSRHPKFWSPADYEKSFREGCLSVAQAAAMSRSSTSTEPPPASLSNSTSPQAVSSPAALSTSGQDVDSERVRESKGQTSTLQRGTLARRSAESAGGPVRRSSESEGGTDRCSYTSSDGRRCRMFRSPDHPELCHHHAEQEVRALDRIPVLPLAADLLSVSGQDIDPETGRKSKGAITDFRTAAAINAALGNLFVQLADGRIDPRRAAVLGYLGQLLHQTLKRIGWEQHQDRPSPNLQAYLAAILKSARPRTRADKRTHQALSAVVFAHDPAHNQR